MEIFLNDIKPRNYGLEGNGDSAKIFSYVCNTLSGIAASVRCVHSTPVVLNAKLPD